MEELWYKNVAYEDAKELVKENLVNTVAAFIASGYWLKHIRDGKEYEIDGYQSFWEAAEAEFGLKMSEASRAMSMNDKYSKNGNSPYMCDDFKLYSKSQLQEMLTMSEEQMEQVTPDMTVKEIREIKNPVPDEPLATSQELVNTELEAEPEEELQDPILTEIEMASEQEEELNIAFDTNEIMQELDDVIDGEYREITEEDADAELKTGTVVKLDTDECARGLRDIKWLLEKKNKELEEYLSVDGIPEDVIFEKKTIVGALASMVCDLEEVDMEQEAEIADILPVIESVQQPELPKFKNNNERKAWLEDVEAWGLWYEDHNIEARYYKYDFPDGSRLIAVKYRYSCPPWLKHVNGELDGTYNGTYYHMICPENLKRTYHQKYYTHSTESISELTDYLKEIQKKGRD